MEELSAAVISFTALVRGSAEQSTLVVLCKPSETMDVARIIREREMFEHIQDCYFQVAARQGSK